jgi:hypothetical protein
LGLSGAWRRAGLLRWLLARAVVPLSFGRANTALMTGL